METKFKKIKRTIVDLVPVNYYLVSFEAIWGTHCNPGKHDDCSIHGCDDNEPSHIAEVDGSVNKVTQDNYMQLNAIGMTIESNTNYRYDDTHDLRSRLFKTKHEAVAHMEYTLSRFKNPQPWESFVKIA